jgi:hypothetical protein
MVSHEEYRRMEGFMEGFVYERKPNAPDDVPLFHYVLVNFTLLGVGLAAWTAVVAGVVWMLS